MSKTRKVVRFKLDATRGTRYSSAEFVADGVQLLTTFYTFDLESKQTYRNDKSGERCATPEEALARAAGLFEQHAPRYQNKNRTEEEVPDLDGDVAPGAANPALESELLASRGTPAEAGAASVYADWLQTNGDIRGELASLFLAGKTDEANQWIARNATRLFGELDVKLDSEIYDLVWSHGFLAGASLKRAGMDSGTRLGPLTEQFLALPVSR